MRPFIGALLLSASLLGPASAEPYTDKLAIRTAAFCTGVTTRASDIYAYVAAQRPSQAEILPELKRLIALHKEAAAELSGFTAAYVEAAGMTAENALAYVSMGQEAADKFLKGHTLEKAEEFVVAARRCVALAEAVASEDANVTSRAFDLALKHFASYVAH